jgi:hypothetical protein
MNNINFETSVPENIWEFAYTCMESLMACLLHFMILESTLVPQFLKYSLTE